ncbi:alanine--glyoxylate aminotransferase 2, mitochondrial, partial [Orussus abietinus]|uniref:alanine--glyoxylate aminotransferase 2, mitochondrial n=1 Tax=Orussus abietinus TaxID=222816 RepID=UPI000C715ED8
TRNPDVYKGPWGNPRCRDSPVTSNKMKCQCTNGECLACEMYLEDFENVFRHSLPSNGRIAGFIAESIQGVGGVVQYPRRYLQRVQKRIRQNGGLFIADEVQTGFGRTGEHFWGFKAHEVEPDIITMAKGIGNGFPMAAVATKAKIAETLSRALHFNTFGGNPLACAAGCAVLDIIEEEDLQKNSLVVGTYLLHRLSALMIDHPTTIGDIRGKGLMIGVELISDVEKKSPLPAEQVADILEDIKNMNVLVGKGGLNFNVLRIKPPMCITKEDADYTVDVLNKALERHRDKYLRDKESVFFSAV